VSSFFKKLKKKNLKPSLIGLKLVLKKI